MIASTVYALAQPRGVRSSIQIAPPFITKPFSIFGSTTRIIGGKKGKLSEKTKCNSMYGTLFSRMSCDNSDSGSTPYTRTYHSNKLSLTSSTYKWLKFIDWNCICIYFENDFERSEKQILTYRKCILLHLWRSLNFLELFHKSLRSNGFVVEYVGIFLACAWRYSAETCKIILNIEIVCQLDRLRESERESLLTVVIFALDSLKHWHWH